MSEKRLYLGIDTSCYTTSVAADTGFGVIHIKKPLRVKEGECGLRQSEAVFQHIKNLPLCFDEMKKSVDFASFDKMTVTVSAKPRNLEGSYMPVFTVGQAFAKAVADVTGAEYFETSHQEGHIMAAVYSGKKFSLLDEAFLSYHISGGTTELLLVSFENGEFKCKIVGGTLDLPAGQFIDRVGVKLGMDFPCGKYLDYSACEYSGSPIKVKTCVKGEYINFSGEETRRERAVENGESSETAAFAVMKCISQSLKCSVMSARERYSVKNIVMAGGVSSSKFLRNEFSDMPAVYFAEAELSTDNAVGVCQIGKLKRQA